MQSRRVERLVVVESRSRSRSALLGGVLLDVDVPLRDVGLRLVVVVVADEVLDRVLREQLLELLVELGGQGLVVRDDQDGPVQLGDDVGHREGLADAGHAHQGLEPSGRSRRPSTSRSIACGWSPAGWNWLFSLKPPMRYYHTMPQVGLHGY